MSNRRTGYPARIEYAARLVSTGEASTRRSLEAAVKEKFGVGIGHTEALAVLRDVKRELRAEPATDLRVREKNVRSYRYNWYIARHFQPEEAAEFSRMKSPLKAGSDRYDEITIMMHRRERMYNRFVQNHPDLNPGSRLFQVEFRATILSFYRRNAFMTFSPRMKRVMSPWDWFDKISGKLPPERRYIGPHKSLAGVTAKGKEKVSERDHRKRMGESAQRRVDADPSIFDEEYTRMLNVYNIKLRRPVVRR